MVADDPGQRQAFQRAIQIAVWAGIVCVWVILAMDAVAASNAAVGLGNASREELSVPRWLYLVTGGAVIGASGLLASVVTDRALLHAIHAWHRVLPTRAALGRWLVRAGRLVGLAALVLVVVLGFTGPQLSTVSFATVVIFAGGRAGLTMVSYLVGDPWPALNPWRTLADALPVGPLRSYPKRWGIWPATIGLLALVFVETITSVTSEPATLALAVLGYTAYTLAGAVVVGPVVWFRFADPIAVTFRQYARVAPLQRADRRLELRLPGAALAEGDEPRTDTAGFAIALIWELTFSGFVTTQPGTDAIAAAVSVAPSGFVGLALAFVQVVLLIAGYALFFGLYWLAARLARQRVDTYRPAREIGTWMAPPLLAIAAGYHLAHYFWLFVSNIPTLMGVLVSPLSLPANPTIIVLPGWANGLNVAFVLVGHLLAVWIAHARSFDLFPSRLQAIRSQHPFVAVMIVYTVLSLWLLSLPSAS